MDVKAQAKALRPLLDAALAELVKQRPELQAFRSGTCQYDPSAGTISFKVTAEIKGAIGKEASYYEQSRMYDKELPPLGTTFKNGQHTDKIVGMNSTGTKIITERMGGGKYVWKIGPVKRLCGINTGPSPV